MMQEKEISADEMDPGQRLEYALGELRLSQTNLAKKCDVSPQYVNNILRRGQRITEDFAISLARTLDINLNWLFLGEGEMLLEDEKTKEESPGQQTGQVENLLKEAAQNLCRAADILQ